MFEIDHAVVALGLDEARAGIGDAVIRQRNVAADARGDETVVLVDDFRMVDLDQAAERRLDRAAMLVRDLVVVEQDGTEIRGRDVRAVLVGDAVVAERNYAAAILGLDFGAGAAVEEFEVGHLDRARVLGEHMPSVADEIAGQDQRAAQPDGFHRAGVLEQRVSDPDRAEALGVHDAAVAHEQVVDIDDAAVLRRDFPGRLAVRIAVARGRCARVGEQHRIERDDAAVLGVDLATGLIVDLGVVNAHRTAICRLQRSGIGQAAVSDEDLRAMTDGADDGAGLVVDRGLEERQRAETARLHVAAGIVVYCRVAEIDLAAVLGEGDALIGERGAVGEQDFGAVAGSHEPPGDFTDEP